MDLDRLQALDVSAHGITVRKTAIDYHDDGLLLLTSCRLRRGEAVGYYHYFSVYASVSREQKKTTMCRERMMQVTSELLRKLWMTYRRRWWKRMGLSVRCDYFRYLFMLWGIIATPGTGQEIVLWNLKSWRTKARKTCNFSKVKLQQRLIILIVLVLSEVQCYVALLSAKSCCCVTGIGKNYIGGVELSKRVLFFGYYFGPKTVRNSIVHILFLCDLLVEVWSYTKWLWKSSNNIRDPSWRVAKTIFK